MRVKVISAKYRTLWYADSIGDVFEVRHDLEEGHYKIIGKSIFIHLRDGAIVEDVPTPMSVNYINPDTVVVWDDGDVTRVTCKEGERWDEYIGFLACLAKKVYGGHNQYKKFIKNASVQNE